ncbi:MAG TPA: 3-deoxy-D-manno-octulosonic acid transferase [Desulfobacterales bacterium]|nr:3-deoxy-D-manno-octulosonic acid transferase [Desulfobacterales bacterium]
MRNRAFLTIYESLWRGCLPLLRLSTRLREGWAQRTLKATVLDRADIWIQAASVGEAYLALHLAKALREDADLKIMITSSTSQGVELLTRSKAQLSIKTAYFPFDLPALMSKALTRVGPKVMVLLETELWPGLFASCNRLGIPLLILNGRLSSSSFRGHLLLKGFWHKHLPKRVLAVSTEDAARYSLLFGRGVVGTMHNMKFDRVSIQSLEPEENPLKNLFPSSFPFVVFGSVRKEEEADIQYVIQRLRMERDGLLIGLFPRHMHRVEAWEKRLSKAQIPYQLRSQMDKTSATRGGVILWDKLGELGFAYGLSRAVFVGGSLRPCGGQNFLEPLTYGVVPNVGPYLDNFQWIGSELFSIGLARQIKSKEELVSCLLKDLSEPKDPQKVLGLAQAYLRERQGGTQEACKEIMKRIFQP